jgi:uncharacterized membrane protein
LELVPAHGFVLLLASGSPKKRMEVSMVTAKITARLIAATMLLSTGFVLYAQDPANAAKFCAELRGSTPTGQPDCSFSTLGACRAHIRAGGGGHCYKLRQ